MNPKLEEILTVIEQTALAKGGELLLVGEPTDLGHITFAIQWKNQLEIPPTKYSVSLQENTVTLNPEGFSWKGIIPDSAFLAQAKKDLLRISWIDKESFKPATVSNTTIRVNTLNNLLNLLSRFPRVAKQLTQRYNKRIGFEIVDEYDVQDLLYSLLHLYFDDVRREDPVPIQAGGSSRIDFLLKQEQIGIEVKIATEKLRDKELGDQLSVDIQRYQAHPHIKTLIYFVYDPQRVVINSAGLQKDFAKKHQKLDVKVIIAT